MTNLKYVFKGYNNFGIAIGKVYLYGIDGVVILGIGAHCLSLTAPIFFVMRIFSFLHGLLPACYAVGAHSCDHGGQVYQWYPVFTWNIWHAERLAISDIGDGPDTWHKISLKAYFELCRNGGRVID